MTMTAAIRWRSPGVPSERERISHVIRRLGMGAAGPLVADAVDVDDAIDRSLDLSTPAVPMPDFEPPSDFQSANQPRDIAIPLGHWIEQMVTSPRRIEERLVWFWHDHFATGFRKVRMPYLMWQQHATIREHATGRFDVLLKAIARDPAMLDYLDGRTNEADAVNENFAREAMELHTMGRGHYTQDDVVAAARAFSGWVIVPGPDDRRSIPGVDPWSALFIPFRHDGGLKTLLGVTATLDMDDALDVMLDHPATAVRVASKLYTELVGLGPDDATATRLGDAFGRDWEIMPLVEAIVSDPAFLSDDAVGSRVRTPVEKAIGIAQGFGASRAGGRAAIRILDGVGYVPFSPPNPAGFPSGERLLGPFQLAHSLDLVSMLPRPSPRLDAVEIFERLGLFDLSATSLDVVDAAPDPAARIGLAAASPAYALT